MIVDLKEKKIVVSIDSFESFSALGTLSKWANACCMLYVVFWSGTLGMVRMAHCVSLEDSRSEMAIDKDPGFELGTLGLLARVLGGLADLGLGGPAMYGYLEGSAFLETGGKACHGRDAGDGVRGGEFCLLNARWLASVGGKGNDS